MSEPLLSAEGAAPEFMWFNGTQALQALYQRKRHCSPGRRCVETVIGLPDPTGTRLWKGKPGMSCITGILVVSCTFSTLSGGVPYHFGSLFDPLSGMELTLEVDRISEHPDVPMPFHRLDETDYEAVENGASYRVSFSEDMTTISIMPDSVSGILAENKEEYMAYDLNSGLFAGGRFLVWIVDGRFSGEYTIYGSGFPIISSERGSLVP
jgi:hypothetical protein